MRLSEANLSSLREVFCGLPGGTANVRPILGKVGPCFLEARRAGLFVVFQTIKTGKLRQSVIFKPADALWVCVQAVADGLCEFMRREWFGEKIHIVREGKILTDGFRAVAAHINHLQFGIFLQEA